MIKYRLKCKDCEIISDSWFSSFKDFDKIKKLKLLTCNSCGSNQIEKSLMSPNLSNNKKNLFRLFRPIVSDIIKRCFLSSAG